MPERRTDPRAKLIVQVDSAGQEAFTLGKSQDISLGGMMILSPETLAAQTEVQLRFALPVFPRAITIETKGVVVRAQAGKFMAIQFVDLKPEDRDAIARFVGSAPAQ